MKKLKLGPPRTPENSAFPLWILRLEPFLNDRACRNVVYRMFSERRSRLPLWRKLLIAFFGTANFPSPVSIVVSLGTLAVMGGLTGVLFGIRSGILFLAPLTCCLWIFVPFILWPWIKQKLARRRLASPGLPLWISDVFLSYGVHVQAVTDLYMVGLRGPDIIMSIYTEARERTWRFWFVMGAMLDLALIAIFIRTPLYGMERVLIGIPYLFLLYQFLRLMQAIGAWRLVAREITMRYAHWRGEVTLLKYFRRGAHDSLGVLASIILIVIFTAYGAEIVDAIYPQSVDEKIFFVLRGRTFLVMGGVALLGFLISFLARVMMDGISFSIEASLKEAHQRYTDFVTTRVLEDSPFIVPARYQRRGVVR